MPRRWWSASASHEKTINGIRHGVIEVRYALFPQKSGELTIPAQLFSATTVINSSNSVFGTRGGRSIQVLRRASR